MKLSKRIKSTLCILFSWNMWCMSAVYRPMSNYQKKICSHLWCSNKQYIYIFKPCHSIFMLFHAKIGVLGKYFYVSHPLFILYLEGNHTLFGEKWYFIWKFSSGKYKVSFLLSLFDQIIIPDKTLVYYHLKVHVLVEGYTNSFL